MNFLHKDSRYQRFVRFIIFEGFETTEEFTGGFRVFVTPGDFSFFKMQQRKWDQKWRLVIFDIDE
ncbi:MAG: hypothetical protein ACFFDI_31675, partial [Promethearchaeota archaeon]